MNTLELSDRFAYMWRKSREDAGKSQDYLAKALGVSKKTIQNWENGIGSPSQMMGFQWFDVLGLQPLPYYLELLYPSEFNNLSHCKDSALDKALMDIISSLPDKYKQELLFILSGHHGSSICGILEMLTAHLHAPLRERVNVALSIATNYKIAEVHKVDCSPANIQPNLELLEESIYNALNAVYTHKESYTDFKINKPKGQTK